MLWHLIKYLSRCFINLLFDWLFWNVLVSIKQISKCLLSLKLNRHLAPLKSVTRSWPNIANGYFTFKWYIYIDYVFNELHSDVLLINDAVGAVKKILLNLPSNNTVVCVLRIRMSITVTLIKSCIILFLL